MSKRRCDRSQTTIPPVSLLPAQLYKPASEELDALVDSFIDLIIDDFIEKYRSDRLDVAVLKKKGGKMF